MRPAHAFSLGAVVVTLLLASLALIEFTRPTGWQDELIGHLTRLAADGDEVRLLSLQRASWPSRFDGHLSHVVHGNQSYTVKPLPYPPDAVYCVCLEHKRGVLPARRRLAFVARHHDLYNGDWLLHEGEHEPFGAQLILDLEALGCTAVLDP
jgi:hypothetical protein